MFCQNIYWQITFLSMKNDWNTRKVQSLFPLKDKVDHYSCAIYLEVCSYDQNYIGETVRNAKIQWNEHTKIRTANQNQPSI